MDYYEIEHIIVSVVAACEVQGDTCAPEWIREETSSSTDLTTVQSIPPHPPLHTMVMCSGSRIIVSQD